MDVADNASWSGCSLRVFRLLCNPHSVNPLAPNDVYTRRTAQLTSRRCILNIYSTDILTEYFELAAQSPFFSLFNMPFIS